MAVEVVAWCHTERPGRRCNDPRSGRQPQEVADMADATPCAFEGCAEGGRRWYGLCQRHAAQYTRRGRDMANLTPLHAMYADVACVVCGTRFVSGYGTRRWCSGRCQQEHYRYATPRPTSKPCMCGEPIDLTARGRSGRRQRADVVRCLRCRPQEAYRYGTARPTSTVCTVCGESIDLTAVGKSGRRQRVDIKVCQRCRQSTCRAKLSARFLARRDGTTCRLCGEPVDMTLRRPDQGTPSVDHILPLAKGGTNDPANLQLAHLRCNQLKAARVDGVARTDPGPRSDGSEAGLPWP